MRMFAVPAAWHCLEHGAAPFGHGFFQAGSVDYLLPFLDVVNYGFAQFQQHRAFGTPDSGVKSLMDILIAETGLQIITGSFEFASVRRQGG